VTILQNPKTRIRNMPIRGNLALEETTIAETLRGAGYQTFFAGKWHLGDTGHLPTDQGFDINIGGMHRGSPPGGYYAPYKNPQLKSKNDGEYLTQRLTDESVRFMQSRDVERPFLMYLSYYNVHTPITAYKKRIQEYRDRAQAMFKTSTPIAPEKGGGNDAAQSRMRQDDPRYGSMVAAVDDSVGQLMRCLEDLGIQDNTVVCFFSDNGGLCTLGKNRKGPTCNLPLRSGKGWLYEGGIREPFIIRAPGVTTAGTQCNTPVQSVDFYPTLLQLAGLPLQPRLHADGRSLVSLLRGKSDPDASTRALYWHYPHYHGSQWCPGAAIRDGDWKLIRFYETDIDELYNLRTDPGEQQNVAEANPAIRDALIEKLKGWQKEIGARMPPRL
ncbi:MAG: sulfatase, partial [Planctomycetota bacterium]